MKKNAFPASDWFTSTIAKQPVNGAMGMSAMGVGTEKITSANEEQLTDRQTMTQQIGFYCTVERFRVE
jgi:hypothetical protein